MDRTLGREAGLSRRGVYLLAAELRDAGTEDRRAGASEVERLWLATGLVPDRP